MKPLPFWLVIFVPYLGYALFNVGIPCLLESAAVNPLIQEAFTCATFFAAVIYSMSRHTLE